MNFINGADISSLQAMEDNGANFYDFDGVNKDVIEILKNHGINCIRLRVFNNPTMSFDAGDYCDIKKTAILGKRVKKQELSLMIAFHYSDFWADWQKQNIPKEWSVCSVQELIERMYEYTYSSLELLHLENSWPDYIQVGNEIGNGLLWPFGKIPNYKAIADFLSSGLSAIKDASLKLNMPLPKTIIHLECGGNMAKTESFFKEIMANGCVEFDIVGLSYYPFWAGPIEALTDNIKNIRDKFQKKVFIVETSFPYTDESTDDMPNIVTEQLLLETMNLKATPENQFYYIKNFINLMKECYGVDGVFYWEPIWYAIPKVGVEKGKGNEWENQAVFDNSGRPLIGLKGFEM